MTEDNIDMKWMICPSCYKADTVQDTVDESDEEDTCEFDFKIHEIRLFLQNKTIPMIDINCPGRNDIDKTKMSQKDKERNRFHYRTYYLEEYTHFLNQIDSRGKR